MLALGRLCTLGLGLALCASAVASASEGDALAARIDRIAARGPLKGASLGIYVARLEDGRTVYARGEDRLLIPASNQKILTALGALHRFGPTHRFETRVWAPTPPDANGRVASLLVEGRGDPAMNSEDWWLLAAELRGAGLTAVEGAVRIDDSHFDGPGWHPSWGRVSARAYHAPVGALTANYGSFFVSIRPNGSVGSAALVDVEPPIAYLRVRNLARTVSRERRPRLSVDRVRGRTEAGAREEIVRVDGATRIGDGMDRFPRSVLDPGLYAGSLLVHQLEAQGVPVDGIVRRLEGRPTATSLLLERPGRPLAEIVGLCMKYSNNAIAEVLIKNLAAFDAPDGEPVRQGTWAVGVEALRAELAQLGVDASKATLVDGSGLSLQNRLSPRMLAGALRAGWESFRIGPEFVAALPIAERDGTLEDRLEAGGGRIRAKTGLLSDASVTALSGYAERGDGRTLVFSILVNGHGGSSRDAMDAVDRIATALLEAPLSPDTAQTR